MAKSFPRIIETSFKGKTSDKKVRLLFGARQTGKSTLLTSMSSSRTLFINLQNRQERLRFERNPGELVQMLRAESSIKTVLIDEIQKVPDILDDVQLLYDENPGKFSFILTGSSSRKLRASSANLLPGRAHQYHLFPLVLGERKGAKTSKILPLPQTKGFHPAFPAAVIEDILLYGNLPGIVQEKEDARRATLESYAEIYLEEEIRREALVRNIGYFSRFLELAALEAGQLMNLTNISNQTHIPVATIRSFYELLVDTYTGYWLTPYAKRARKRLLTTPMFFFFDTGVRNSLARIPIDKQILSVQAGTLFQQWATTELWHRCGYLGRTYKLYFWRTVSGAEVDIVLETPRETIPIEVKWTDSPREADARHLVTFINTYPERARRGFIVCRVPRRLQMTEKVTAIPWQEL